MAHKEKDDAWVAWFTDELQQQLDAAARPYYGSQELKQSLKTRYICQCKEPKIPPNAQDLIATYEKIHELVLFRPELANRRCRKCKCLDPNQFRRFLQ
uniref:Uncharacterized protein n=1 Tax=Panagrolaimus davidi TaxID=227884 RepID=A0A914PCP5_9BILA